MINSKVLCKKHLLGEHVEHHMFIGTLKRRKNISGYIVNNLFEPLSLKNRHNELVKEIKNRNYNHNSPLEFDDNILSYLNNYELNYKINKNKSLNDLLNRCEKCRERYKAHVVELADTTDLKSVGI